jgi:hypothetical protein
MLDLFVYRRAVAPRDTAWESAPLVLHDEGLITVRVGWPPHEPEQPWDLVEAMTRILGHHPGPVSSFRLHSSLSPDVDTLGCWMDLLSEKGVAVRTYVTVDRINFHRILAVACGRQPRSM